jgi:hypothetical protein
MQQPQRVIHMRTQAGNPGNLRITMVPSTTLAHWRGITTKPKEVVLDMVTPLWKETLQVY